MTEKTEQALSTFRSGMNCAQSVLSVYSEQYDLDYNRALSISCGFGGGMGRLQKTCGAVTAAFMVLSLHHCSYDIDPEQKKDYTYKDIRSFNDAFIALHGSTECNELTGYDLKTGFMRQFASDA
jgi:C_GCAxxG_C_C family probable redox protein